MTNSVQLSPRDRSLLQLLSWTPATTMLLLQASSTFAGGSFTDERRLRERLQTLERAGFVRHWSTATIGGGLQNYYKLTPAGYQVLYGIDATPPPRSFFVEIAPSFLAHTLKLAEVIVATNRAAHEGHIEILGFHRENELAFVVGDAQVQPDCFYRLSIGGRNFNVAFEIDQSTETVDSLRDAALRHRLGLYDAYQEQLLQSWLAAGRTWERPRFRVVFLTVSIQRAYHILATMAQVTQRPARRLVYAAVQESYLGSQTPLSDPLLLDHSGHWQALVELHPTSRPLRSPIRLPHAIQAPQPGW